MNQSIIISKMNEFMLELNAVIGEWLQSKLPEITPNWWDDLVINNLSDSQYEQVKKNEIHELKEFDLEALLRILDRNWFIIATSFFVDNKERVNIHKMQETRNAWALIIQNDISKEKIIDDLETIKELFELFGASIQVIRELEHFIIDVSADNNIKNNQFNSVDEKPVEVEQSTNQDITVGKPVCLVSDESIVGAVTEINGNKYTVLLGGEFKNFYKEQIKLHKPKSCDNVVSLSRLRSSMTAYQIYNPGSSNLYSLNAARIDFVPYQFRPALKIIKSESSRILVADDVGVGKTIEAGLILKELEARSSINSVLIICPRPLVAERKWEMEMKRFDENFSPLDGKVFLQSISDTNRDGEWPERHSKTIIPYSLFSETNIMGGNGKTGSRRRNIGLAELDPLPRFDLVIVDEAHHIRNPQTWQYKGVDLFCRNADTVVFLTATPLQNSDNDLYTLLNLLRPDVVLDKETFKMMSEPNRNINNLLGIIRRQADSWQKEAKSEIAEVLTTSWGRNVIQHNPNFAKIYDYIEKPSITRAEKIEALSRVERLHSFSNIINRTRRRDIEDFCMRRTVTVEVDFSSVQRDLYDAVIEFESAALAQLHGKQNVRFMMCTIMRQAASCLYGLAPFLNELVNRRLDQIQEDGEIFEYDYEFNDDDTNSLSELAGEIAKLTEKLPVEDPKYTKMYEVVKNKNEEENNKVIIFSSFRHTLRYIYKKLKKSGIRVGQVDGSVPDEERYSLRKRFMRNKNDEQAIDVLLFTEVGCEGLDYQFCDTMINYDLPWNPMRIEQRIGRIDRRGQKSESVQIYNMITKDTIDAVIYDRCLSKIGVFEASIGDCSEILGDISNKILKIMFDSNLTADERNHKLEKMADNDVMKVHEMQKLEQDEKALFGFDLSNYMMNKDVQEAENSWISPQSMNEMVGLFLNDLLGDGEYLKGKTEHKNLRLSSDKRIKLLDNLKNLSIANNNAANKLWSAYLKSEKSNLPVTFDSTYAKDNREIVFLTQMHPLVIQAAKYESNSFPWEVGVRITNELLKPGDYEFLVYAWKYVGFRPDIKMIAISENAVIQNNILEYIKYADQHQIESSDYDSKWHNMDALHYDKWAQERKDYIAIVEDDCFYRLEQLSQSFKQREAVFIEMIRKAEDERIQRMRHSQLDKLRFDFEKQKKEISSVKEKADIHSNLLVKGVVHVE